MAATGLVAVRLAQLLAKPGCAIFGHVWLTVVRDVERGPVILVCAACGRERDDRRAPPEPYRPLSEQEKIGVRARGQHLEDRPRWPRR